MMRKSNCTVKDDNTNDPPIEVKILQSIWTENEVGPGYYKLKKLSAWAGEADHQLVSELDVSE